MYMYIRNLALIFFCVLYIWHIQYFKLPRHIISCISDKPNFYWIYLHTIVRDRIICGPFINKFKLRTYTLLYYMFEYPWSFFTSSTCICSLYNTTIKDLKATNVLRIIIYLIVTLKRSGVLILSNFFTLKTLVKFLFCLELTQQDEHLES